MMGRAKPRPGKLFFYEGFRLDNRIRKDHPLRLIKKLVDFGFAYWEVKARYGRNGNVSVPPPVILKLMFLLFYYDVPSERELMATLPERLDWLWFLGYDLDSQLPQYSVLSKARKRWGSAIFWSLFNRTVEQCVGLGLVEGHDVYCDSSLVDANAANDSIRRVGRFTVLAGKLEQRLSEVNEEGKAERKSEEGSKEERKEERKAGSKEAGKEASKGEERKEERAAGKEDGKGKDEAKEPSEEPSKKPDEDQDEDQDKTDAVPERRWVSKTDHEAAVVAGRGGSRARYKTHRMIDGRHGVITATEITAGDVNEAHRLSSLLDQHEVRTGSKVHTVTADSKYGTIDNYLHCHDRNVAGYLPDMKQATATSGRKRGLFPDTKFRYDPEEDAYICPAGGRLKEKRFHAERQSYEYYGTKGMCDKCPLRQQCTTAKNGRSIKRHLRQDEIDAMRREAGSGRARVALRRRRHLMEGSFADGANNHGLKRARWRGLQRVAIQDYLVAAVQNIRIMLRSRRLRAGVGVGVQAVVSPTRTCGQAILARCYVFSVTSGLKSRSDGFRSI